MNLESKKSQIKSSINSARMLIVFTALPLIGSLLKSFLIDEKTQIDQNPLLELINSFPQINTNDIFDFNNFIILGFIIGLLIGISSLKKGISQMIELDKKNNS